MSDIAWAAHEIYRDPLSLWCRPTTDNSFNRALTSRASHFGLGTS
jgi:hypothetical protein